MTQRTILVPASRAPRLAASSSNSLFDTLFELIDLLYDFITVINAFFETLLNFGDYLNGE